MITKNPLPTDCNSQSSFIIQLYKRSTRPLLQTETLNSAWFYTALAANIDTCSLLVDSKCTHPYHGSWSGYSLRDARAPPPLKRILMLIGVLGGRLLFHIELETIEHGLSKFLRLRQTSHQGQKLN